MNDAAGAAATPEPLKYPQAAATIQPTRRPTTTAQDFMIGEPNRSARMMVTKTKKPSPMNSAEPQGSACGASLLGQSWYGPDVGREEHEPDPPAQSVNPDCPSEIPITATVGPVTRGGNSFFSHSGLENERAISSRAQRDAVPSRAP